MLLIKFQIIIQDVEKEVHIQPAYTNARNEAAVISGFVHNSIL